MKSMLGHLMASASDWQRWVLLGGFALVAFLLQEPEALGMAFIPIFAGPGGGECGCGDGGGDGAGGGGGGGSDCSSGCNTADCTAGECSSGCGSSTPFLCVWDGKRYVFENDVLVAPKTLRNSRAVGQREYEAGEITSDTYRIEQKLVPDADGLLRLALKEVEPEESYIDSLSLTRVVAPQDALLLSNPDHGQLQAFSRREVESLSGVTEVRAVLRRGSAHIALGTNPQAQEGELMLDPGEILEVSGTISGEDASPFVLIRSRYRDWTAGTIAGLEVSRAKLLRSPWSVRTAAKFAGQTTVLAALSGLLWFGGLTQRNGDGARDAATLLGAHYSVPAAHADACHSLIVEYFAWDTVTYKQVAVVQPRHYRATLEAAALPSEAVSKTGQVRVRITATKRHAVSLASLFVADTRYEDSLQREALALVSARNEQTGEDSTPVVTQRNSGEYLHLLPSDVIELRFASGRQEVPEGYIASYALETAGFYTPLSREGRQRAGDWVPRLDAEARSWLEEMYVLGDYRKSDRRPVLTRTG